MSLKDCIARVRAAGAGADMTDDQVLQIIQAVETRAKAKRARGGLKSAAEDLAAAAKELSEEARIEALMEKRSRLINLARKSERDARYGDAEAGNEVAALEALNVGARGPTLAWRDRSTPRRSSSPAGCRGR